MIDLTGKRILITQATDFMGPSLCEVFAELGATLIADARARLHGDAVAELVGTSGPIDVLVANLGVPAPTSLAVDATDQEWRTVFEHMVDPLQRIVRAVLPQMIARKAGKILLMGSAAGLRGQKRTSTYSAARGAQLAYIQSVGVEVARYNVQVNAIAQTFVDNPMYFPPEVQADPRFQERLQREVPLGRLVTGREDASFAAYLCSDFANCFVGQIFPLCGGWIAR